MKREFFNFEDLGRLCGVPDNANNNRRLGKMLQRIARRDGVRPIRPSDVRRLYGRPARREAVHYPIAMLAEAELNVRVEFRFDVLQRTIPDETEQL